MEPSVRIEKQPTPHGLDYQVYVLETAASRAKIVPALGFNCFSWQVQHRGEMVELLWSDPEFFTNPQPTRSGIPILFPFPNRIRGGRFAWADKTYQLPINDPQDKNAIHGFACYRPWRVASTGLDEESARIQAQFQGGIDARDCLALWPADYRIETSYALKPSVLCLSISVANMGKELLPFGFGIHPYFRFQPDDVEFQLAPESIAAGSLEQWHLEDCLPSGKREALQGHHRKLLGEQLNNTAGLKWDDAFRFTPQAGSANLTMRLVDRARRLSLVMACSEEFRDLVVFTPPHREAICLEPYTCITDAINLQQRGVDAGLKVLQEGECWFGEITLSVE